MRFFIRFLPGENWMAGKHIAKQPYINEHAAYIQDCFDKGQVTLAGPTADGQGGLCVIDVEDEQEAERIVEEDPAVIQRTLNWELQGWKTIFDQYEQKSLRNNSKHLHTNHTDS